jgi:hypothetical protein
MSLAKAVPDGLKDRKCKKITLRKCPPNPYALEKDCVQETVSAFKNNHLKMQIGKGTELQVPIWLSGTREAYHKCGICPVSYQDEGILQGLRRIQ